MRVSMPALCKKLYINILRKEEKNTYTTNKYKKKLSDVDIEILYWNYP